ncbi:2-amino-4-hydroxy-6-hydroxymethyldihydropteridine diphosphokinase [Alphaproteobacteria bacterium 46_93_T64]|nr:2-amino-4-hydroxy-6-hydroxymethyldihydropteridine diphosphokinase [Alphaproteobacteria bacterium 46_93_T64]
MILIALGANLEHPIHGAPVNSLVAALEILKARGLKICFQSSWYKTAPVPISDQPWFVNAVIAIETDLDADELLELLHSVEAEFGRVREIKWEARVLDLDLISYDALVTENREQTKGNVIPHPHMGERAFVLAPIIEILPDWRHPINDLTAQQMMTRLDGDQAFEVVPSS